MSLNQCWLKVRSLTTIRWEMEYPGENPGATALPDMMAWRAHQLDFRVREVYAAYESFKRFLAGETGQSDADAASIAAALKDKVDVNDLQLAGHSFGGATALRLLETTPPSSFTPLPIRRTVLLDPWMEPFPNALSSLPSKAPPPSTLVINSQDWTEGNFFSAEIDAVQPLGATLCTIAGLGREWLVLCPRTY